MRYLNIFCLLIISIVISFGFNEPCKKIVYNNSSPFWLTKINFYPDCNDSSTYIYKEFNPDSSLHALGNVINNKKEGEWITFQSKDKFVKIYEKNTLVKYEIRDSVSNNLLTDDYILNDSITKTINYFKNGQISGEGYRKNGDNFGVWVEYDSLKEFEFKGEYLGYIIWDTTLRLDPLTGEICNLVIGHSPKVGKWLRKNLKTGELDTLIYK